MKKLLTVGAVLCVALFMASCSTVSDRLTETAEVLASLDAKPQDFRVFVDAPASLEFESGDVVIKYFMKSKGRKLRTIDASLDRTGIGKRAGGRQRVTFALEPADVRRFEAQQTLMRQRVAAGRNSAAFYGVALDPGCTFIESLDPSRKQNIDVLLQIGPDVAPIPALKLKFTGRGVPHGTRLVCR
nr:hypothetical protein [Marinicella sp. W31]MDC2879918.1 hypothetical protein [Marinicella sp. W31]